MSKVPFCDRHIGVNAQDRQAMLDMLGVSSLDALTDAALPATIRFQGELELPSGASEREALDELNTIMAQNLVLKSFIGQGYYGTFVPPVIQRNLFENPAWYTAYTPYQAEISQGRLELLFHFQTLVCELTGLSVATASLLDEATALAEAIAMAVRFSQGARTHIALAGTLSSHLMDVVATRAHFLDFVITKDSTIDEDTAALIIPWPDQFGLFHNWTDLISLAKAKNVLIIVVADPLSLTLIDAPAHWGADIVVGSMQRFGVPMGFGGPHAGFLAASQALSRLVPGRIVGQSTDQQGRTAYRLALQTREQHIRRDKATSNICTAQALLANMAAAYAIWHGPSGLQSIALQIHQLASEFKQAVLAYGYEINSAPFFDNVTVTCPNAAHILAHRAEAAGYLIRVCNPDQVCVNFDELSTRQDLAALIQIFTSPLSETPSSEKVNPKAEQFHGSSLPLLSLPLPSLPLPLRQEPFLSQPVFHLVHSETDMMRFLRRLSDKDLALDRSMIPLGSCTMKLNPAASLFPLSWATVAQLHPFAPLHHSQGYQQMIKQLEQWLCAITGFSAISFQPNSGAQGEYAGLVAIRRYHISRGDVHRNICLIPASAHGTNPASAAMAGMQVVTIQCLANGNIDEVDFAAKVKLHADHLAALMITYPSTHGVYEKNIKEICELIHAHGGQVYFDGANLNALVGLARPADIGADICHMNLHKTFAIPHGGGGPGAGPIGAAQHLCPFLPGHVFFSGHGFSKEYVAKTNNSSEPVNEPVIDSDTPCWAVSAAPFGSASILVISWMYLRMMGSAGLKLATQTAILNANYSVLRLETFYPVLYKGENGYVAHECIIDTRILKNQFDITIEDIAKRLMDYGFHAPTMSFPVSGTLMIEPTESESKIEIDRLCDALLAIAEEAKTIATGLWTKEDNPLVHAPHTLSDMFASPWTHPYSREQAALPDTHRNFSEKYWPPVSRIDNVAGDRNLICSCPPPNGEDER